MPTDYTNATFIDLSQLQNTPNVTVNFTADWTTVETGVKGIFTKFSWLEVAGSLGVFFAFYVLFSNQKILNLTNMQVVLGASFMTFIFNIGMLYGKYYTTYTMLAVSFIVWLVSLISTIKDN